MERSDSASLEFGGKRDHGRQISEKLAASVFEVRLPSTSVEILRDLGMSKSAIAAYFLRFPDFRRS